MKRICKCLKMSHYKEAKALADAVIVDIPKRHNRVREHKYSDVMVKYIYEHITEQEIDADGMQGIYEHYVNLGTRKWSDYVRIFEPTEIYKTTLKRFSISVTSSYVDNVIVLI